MMMMSRLFWHAFVLLICCCYPSESFGVEILPRAVYPSIRTRITSNTYAGGFNYLRCSSTRRSDTWHLEDLHLSSCVVAAGLALALVRSARSARLRSWHLKSRHRVRSSMQAATSPVLLKLEGVAARTSESQKEILKGVDLTIREGEVHAMMGLNGSGKSTLSRVLVGDSVYEVSEGSATFAGESLFDLDPHDRALSGLFLAFQSPPAVRGVSNLDFLRAIYNAQRRARGELEMDVIEFYGLAAEKLEQLGISADYLNRPVNDGFSGGERKRNEMLQMMILEPKLAILDEIDSGLDIDALKDVARTIAHIRNMNPKRSMLLITHFERFLKYVDADFVHVMHQGKIVRSGGKELATKLDEEGYDWILKDFT